MVYPDPLDDTAREARRLEMRNALLAVLSATGRVMLAAVPETLRAVISILKSRYGPYVVWVIASLPIILVIDQWIEAKGYPSWLEHIVYSIVFTIGICLFSWARSPES